MKYHKTIFLIDDDKDFSSLVNKILCKEGYAVKTFHEPMSAMIESRRHKPNLILMDIMMPSSNGMQAVALIKSDLSLKEIPVIFLTGVITPEAKAIGINSILVEGEKYEAIAKPFEIEKFLERVRLILN